jgi:hypothetical protein
VLAELRGTGLFDRSADFGAISDHVSRHHFEVDAGGHQIKVVVDNLNDFSAADLMHLVPAAERDAFAKLDELRKRLRAIGEHLDADGWVQREPRAYRPHAVAVFVEERGGAYPGERPWPVGVPLADYDEWGGRHGVYCGIVAGEGLDALLAELDVMSRAESYWIDHDGRTRYAVDVRSLLPGEPASCDR